MTDQPNVAEMIASMTDEELANAHTEAIDLGNAATTVTYWPLSELATAIRAELADRGLQSCGRCPASRPGAVDHGCRCDMTREELNADAIAFARMHD